MMNLHYFTFSLKTNRNQKNNSLYFEFLTLLCLVQSYKKMNSFTYMLIIIERSDYKKKQENDNIINFNDYVYSNNKYANKIIIPLETIHPHAN